MFVRYVQHTKRSALNIRWEKSPDEQGKRKSSELSENITSPLVLEPD